jgi:hypothetical protein
MKPNGDRQANYRRCRMRERRSRRRRLNKVISQSDGETDNDFDEPTPAMSVADNL